MAATSSGAWQALTEPRILWITWHRILTTSCLHMHVWCAYALSICFFRGISAAAKGGTDCR